MVVASPPLLSNTHHPLDLWPCESPGEFLPFIFIRPSTWQEKHSQHTPKKCIREESWVVFLKEQNSAEHRTGNNVLMGGFLLQSSLYAAAETTEALEFPQIPQIGGNKRAEAGGKNAFSRCVHWRWKNSGLFLISQSWFSPWDALLLALCFEKW